MRQTHWCRRLQKECSQLPKEFDVVTSDNHCLIRFFTPRHRLLTLDIQEDYPFKPPIVRQNGRVYKEISENMDLLHIYKKKYGEYGCLCLAIWSPDRWGPCFTIEKIVQSIVSIEEKWHEVALSHVSACFPTIPTDIQHAISEYL